MYKELTSNPKCEIVVSTPESQWLRITGKVEFDDDIDLKQRIVDSNEVVESIIKPETIQFLKHLQFLEKQR